MFFSILSDFKTATKYKICTRRLIWVLRCILVTNSGFLQYYMLLLLTTDSGCCCLTCESCRRGQEYREWGCGRWWISGSHKIVGIFNVETWRSWSWAKGKVSCGFIIYKSFKIFKIVSWHFVLMQLLSVREFLKNQITEKQAEDLTL